MPDIHGHLCYCGNHWVHDADEIVDQDDNLVKHTCNSCGRLQWWKDQVSFADQFIWDLEDGRKTVQEIAELARVVLKSGAHKKAI
jgi:hypothetical protein